ncbi:hypothetical protein AC482_03935 [miscellaneous Crenarchaeota group-15 archaeon DG-45]|uniref:Uncharacterized protein n=1 Tax=miscellaneous Crenarchaeota group-15 archaeon DG-45 TaxID=1685127 RepID=A0A0M0BPP7_9ARCH|nr:MAG: hypothetical protein AC482_03935 [miscellaneous Crenarchaeota group-15 archaeon DG-45]
MTARRPRRRYLRFLVASERRYREGEVADAIRGGVLRIYGVRGLSQIAPVLIEFDELGQTGILRCSHIHLRRMRASLAYTTEICGSAASLRVLRVSGTLKSLRTG